MIPRWQQKTTRSAENIEFAFGINYKLLIYIKSFDSATRSHFNILANSVDNFV